MGGFVIVKGNKGVDGHEGTMCFSSSAEVSCCGGWGGGKKGN